MRRLRSLLFLSFVLLSGLPPGCRGDPPSVPRGVVLISIDTLRADYLGVYGQPLPTSPHLDAFAQGGVVFERALSTAPWTLPAHASMLTGRYASGHGARTPDHALSEGVPSLAELLRARGFATAAIVNGMYLSRHFGMDRGFAEYVVVRETETREGAAPHIVGWAADWLERHAEVRFFLFVHFFDVHSDYLSERRFERLFAPGEGRFDGTTFEMVRVNQGELEIEPTQADHLARLYAAGIRQLDHDLSPLLDLLQGETFEETLVVVTSDHGEEFLEHGGLLHTRTQYQELLRVPLFVRGPGLPSGLRVSVPVSLVDLMPTLLSLLGVPAPPDLDGIDLSPLWREQDDAADGAAGRLLFAESALRGERESSRSVTDGRYKLIRELETGATELYDLAADPGEQRNLAGREDAIAAELGAALDRFAETQRTGPSLEIPEEMQERLRALGYQ